jgi:protein subunit release factor A
MKTDVDILTKLHTMYLQYDACPTDDLENDIKKAEEQILIWKKKSEIATDVIQKLFQKYADRCNEFSLKEWELTAKALNADVFDMIGEELAKSHQQNQKLEDKLNQLLNNPDFGHYKECEICKKSLCSRKI